MNPPPSTPYPSVGGADKDSFRTLRQRLLQPLTLLNAIVEGTTDIIIARDRDGRYLYMNAAGVGYTGRSVEEIIGKTDFELSDDPDIRRVAERVQKINQEVMESGQVFTYELNVEKTYNNNGPRTFFATKAPLRDPDTGDIIGIIGIVRDITERKRMEQEREQSLTAQAQIARDLLLSEERLRSTVQAASLATWDFTPPDGPLVWNDRCRELFGLSPEAAVDYDVFLAGLHPEDHDRIHEIVQAVVQPVSDGELDIEFRTIGLEDGILRWVAARGSVTFTSEGEVERFVGIAEDITHRKRSEARIRFLADLMGRVQSQRDPDKVIEETVDSVGPFLDASYCLYADVDSASGTATIQRDWRSSEELPSLAGTWPLDVWGSVVEELRHGKTVVVRDTAIDARTAPSYATSYESLRVRSNISVPMHRNGTWVGIFVVHSASSRNWSDEEVRFLEILAERTRLALETARLHQEMQTEIENRRQTEAELRLVLQRLDYHHTNTPLAVLEWQGEGLPLTQWSQQAETLFGWTKDEVLGRSLTDLSLVHSEDRETAAAAIRRLIAGDVRQIVLENRTVTKQGRIVKCVWYYSALHDANNRLVSVMALAQDVTEARRIETEREKSLTHLRLAFEGAQLGTWDKDLQTGLLTWSEGQEQIYGLPSGTFEGKDRQDDAFFDCVHPDDRARVIANGQDAISSESGAYEDEFRIIRPDGVIRWVLTRARIYRHPLTGEMLRIVGVSFDVTERREAEERRRFITELTERTRSLQNPDALLWETVSSVGQYLTVSRCTYGEVRDADTDKGTVTVFRDYIRDGIASIAGTHRLLDFGGAIIEELRAGRTVVCPDILHDSRLTPENHQAFAGIQARSLLCVPLLKEGRWVSLLVVHHAEPREWTSEEEELLETVAERTWLAVENARLYRAEREIAKKNERIAETLQRSLLVVPEIGAFAGIDLYPYYEPASDDALVGGDFFDVFAIDDERVALVVGDVTGKGLFAASYTAEIKFALRTLLREHHGDTVTALHLLNAHLLSTQRWDGKDPGTFVCVSVAILSTATGAGTLALAGAEPPLIARKSTGIAVRLVEEMLPGAAMLGVNENWKGDTQPFQLAPEDTLLMFTDGLTEARPPKTYDFLGLEGVVGIVKQSVAQDSLIETGIAIVEAVRQHAQGRFGDDVCLLLVRRIPVSLTEK